MPEYILREAAMPDGFCVGVSCKECPFCDDPINGGCKVARFIDAIPAADVEKVVRCGQCKHCVEHYDTDGNAPYWTCKEWDSGTDYDGYCHYGERKDRGQDDV